MFNEHLTQDYIKWDRLTQMYKNMISLLRQCAPTAYYAQVRTSRLPFGCLVTSVILVCHLTL